MSRWENENTANLNLPEPLKFDILYFDIEANHTSAQTKSVAKIQMVDNKENYYVRFGRGEIVDPHGIDKNRIYNFEFKKVSKLIFNNYIEYLKTRREVFLIRARRDFKENV